MNPHRTVTTVEATLGFTNPLRDLLTGEIVNARAHRHATTLPARTVRIFAVE